MNKVDLRVDGHSDTTTEVKKRGSCGGILHIRRCVVPTRKDRLHLCIWLEKKKGRRRRKNKNKNKKKQDTKRLTLVLYE